VGAHLGEEVQGIEDAEVCLVTRMDRISSVDDLCLARLAQQPESSAAAVAASALLDLAAFTPVRAKSVSTATRPCRSWTI